jgi:CRP-like cAMP-binding protein
MVGFSEILPVAALGVVATSSNIIGAALGLYFPLSKRSLSLLLAFASGALISALVIDLAYQGAIELHGRGLNIRETWLIVGGGFAAGAIVYYVAALYLERKGAAIRYPTRFREYARERKRQDTAETVQLLSRSDLLRHLPPQAIQQILPCVRNRSLAPGEILFRDGDIGDALYIVARGAVEVIEGNAKKEQVLAALGPGQTVGEMALLSGGRRTATIRAREATELLAIEKQDFDDLMVRDRKLAAMVEQLSHGRAIQNLSAGAANPDTWANVASGSLEHLSRSESDRIFAETADGAGLAILFGNILDTIPGCLVIGAKFVGFASMSPALIIGMFIGGIPEAAASGAMMRKAGYSARGILLLWSVVMVVGVIAAIAGKIFLGNSGSLLGVFFQAIAGGAVLALIAHAMIPEAIEAAGSLVVLPTVAGFLLAFYLSLSAIFP